ELIEAPQHRVTVPDRPRTVAVSRVLLPRHRVDLTRRRSRPRPRQAPLLLRLPHPQHEVADLGGGHLVPGHVDSLQEPPPSEQVKGVAADTARRMAAGQKVAQEPTDRLPRLAPLVQDHVRDHVASRYDAAPSWKPNRPQIAVNIGGQRHTTSPPVGCMSRTGRHPTATSDTPTWPAVVRSTWSTSASTTTARGSRSRAVARQVNAS